MFTLLSPDPIVPPRLVVLGSGGFIGRSLVGAAVRGGIATLTVRRSELDLAESDAAERLADLLEPGDAVVMAAAITPNKGRDVATFMTNLRMAASLCEAAEHADLGHIVLFSSASVYPTGDDKITETTAPQPSDLFGTMHLAREMMLRSSFDGPLAILRTTQVHGPTASPTGTLPYGPNLLRRIAREDGRIILAGPGDDQRDYIALSDVVALTMRVVRHRGSGLLNLATGTSIAVVELARLVANLFDPPVNVEISTRRGPAAHRHFDVSTLRAAFPDFTFEDLEAALARAHRQEIDGLTD